MLDFSSIRPWLLSAAVALTVPAIAAPPSATAPASAVTGDATLESHDVWELWLNPDTDDFSEIQRRVEAYFEGRYQGRGSGYKQWKRWEETQLHLLDVDGKLINANLRARAVYRAYTQRRSAVSGAPGGTWKSLGPESWVQGPRGYNPGIGRVNVVVVDPATPTRLYAGAPSGGLWRSEDGGISWACLTDGMTTVGVSGIAIDPTDSSTIYIYTGDGDGAATSSIGVMKSTDDGLNWTTLSASPTARGYKLVIDPSDPRRLFAVTRDGIFRTDDGGASWLNQLAGSFRDLEFKPTDSNTVYAVTINSFWKSVDGGDNWVPVTSGLPDPASVSICRIAMAVTPADENYVYLLYGPAFEPAVDDFRFRGLYRSTDGGDTFLLRSDQPNILGYNVLGQDSASQCAYDLALAASPVDAEQIHTAGISCWRSNDGGLTFEATSRWADEDNSVGYTHADVHDLHFFGKVLYVGSDGGVWSSSDYGDTWSNHSFGLRISQFHRLGGTPLDAAKVMLGAQDNGSNLWRAETDYEHMFGADGMECAIDSTDADIFYLTSQLGGLQRTLDGGATLDWIKPGGASGPWITPYIIDPTDPLSLYAGYDAGVYLSRDRGDSWDMFTGAWDSGTPVAVAMSAESGERIYAASLDSVRRTDDASLGVTASWTDVTSGLPGSRLSYVTVDAADSRRVWVTYTGWASGQHVFESENAGATWTDISGTLPALPVYTIVLAAGSDDVLFIGTEVGVFVRTDSSGDWTPLDDGLPKVRVRELEIHQPSSRLRAATYGRGLWELAYDCDGLLAVGNTLLAVKSGVDVELKWTDPQPLAHSWNLYRSTDKRLDGTPTSTLVAAYVDSAAVPAPPSLYFYKTAAKCGVAEGPF